MIHRVGLFIASLAAAGTLVVALTLAGFAPGGGAVTGTTLSTASQEPAAASVQPDPTVQVDTIYLAAPEKPATVTVHRVVPASTSGEGEEHESEGGND
jgi:hypothetical protein